MSFFQNLYTSFATNLWLVQSTIVIVSFVLGFVFSLYFARINKEFKAINRRKSTTPRRYTVNSVVEKSPTGVCSDSTIAVIVATISKIKNVCPSDVVINSIAVRN